MVLSLALSSAVSSATRYDWSSPRTHTYSRRTAQSIRRYYPLPILAMAGAGQVGASIAVYLKTKNQKLKQTIASALPVGFMGIGEPLIYGVTLPLGKPFISACIGGAFGGAVQAFFSCRCYFHWLIWSTTYSKYRQNALLSNRTFHSLYFRLYRHINNRL